MGLDITAYSKCRFVAPRVDDDYEQYEEKHVLIVVAFEGFRARLDGRPEGWWLPEGDSLRFQAGSYGGYNEWREQLCRVALGATPSEVWSNYEDFAGRPFAELINFADNEGAIGPVTSAKLLADFENDPDLPTRLEDADPFGWFFDKYNSWRDAFRLAADDGFVVFH